MRFPVSFCGLIILGLVCGGERARADQCSWTSKAAAQQAVKALQAVDRMLDYCEPCSGATPVEVKIKDVTFRPAADSEGKYFETVVNGKSYDLAYVFVPIPSTHNKFQNLAKLTSCESTSVSAYVTYPPEKNPESWAGTYNKKNVVLSLEQPTAGPLFHAQLSIRSDENGNDRVEVGAHGQRANDKIPFKTPFKGCGFDVKRTSSSTVTLTATGNCGIFGSTVTGLYSK